MRSKMWTALILSAVLMTASLGFAVPQSNALTQRDFSYGSGQHLTASTGDTTVCGNHLCTPGEWNRTHDPPEKQPPNNVIPTSLKSFIPPKPLPIKKVKPLASVL